MKFKIGDRVRIRTDLKNLKKYGSQYFIENMNQNRGKIAIITQVFDDSYSINLDDYDWTDEMLEQFDADLKISQLQSEIDKLSNEVNKIYNNIMSNKDKINYLKEQLKQLKEEEKNKLILSEKEKRYLKEVIRPFKDKVEYIEKCYGSRKEYITIRIISDSPIIFPYFEKNTMYKGMETNKEYTLKELGLDE